MTDLCRYIRYITLQRVTCSGQIRRYERYTPLGGVTIVTAARMAAEMVPMPPFANGCVTVCLTVPFSLPKKSGEVFTNLGKNRGNAHG